MSTTTQARPRLWPLVIAIAACLITAVMLMGGHARSSAATPHGLGPHSDVTVTEIDTPPAETVTVTSVSVDVVPSYVISNVTNTVTAQPVQGTIYTTQTAHAAVTAHLTNRQTLTVNQTNVHQVITTNVFGQTITANVTNTKQVVNVHDLTNTATSQIFETATNTVDAPAAVAATPAKPASFANKARLAIGAGGVAVTSAAGFGFLMLRRRGRYT